MEHNGTQMDEKFTYHVDEHAVSNGWKIGILWWGPLVCPVVVIDISSGCTSHIKWMKNEVNEYFMLNGWKYDTSSGLTVLDIKWMKNDNVDEHNISNGWKRYIKWMYITCQMDGHHILNGWAWHIEVDGWTWPIKWMKRTMTWMKFLFPTYLISVQGTKKIRSTGVLFCALNARAGTARRWRSPRRNGESEREEAHTLTRREDAQRERERERERERWWVAARFQGLRARGKRKKTSWWREDSRGLELLLLLLLSAKDLKKCWMFRLDLQYKG